MIGKRKSDVEIERPLRHRPGVMVIRQNGHRKVIGDGDPFTAEEYLSLAGGYAESTRERLKYSEAEQAELDAAQALLDRALDAVDAAKADLEAQRLVCEMLHRSKDVFSGDTPADDSEVEAADERLRELRGARDKAHGLEHKARVHLTETQRRVQGDARARQFPIELHKREAKTLADQLDEFEAEK